MLNAKPPGTYPLNMRRYLNSTCANETGYGLTSFLKRSQQPLFGRLTRSSYWDPRYLGSVYFTADGSKRTWLNVLESPRGMVEHAAVPKKEGSLLFQGLAMLIWLRVIFKVPSSKSQDLRAQASLVKPDIPKIRLRQSDLSASRPPGSLWLQLYAGKSFMPNARLEKVSKLPSLGNLTAFTRELCRAASFKHCRRGERLPEKWPQYHKKEGSAAPGRPLLMAPVPLLGRRGALS